MTMDLYGLIDHNLWDSASRVGGIMGASASENDQGLGVDENGSGV